MTTTETQRAPAKTAKSEQILDLYATGESAPTIAHRLGMRACAVKAVVIRARRRGDARAALRTERPRRRRRPPSTPAAKIEWTPEVVEKLLAMHAAGETAAVIASELGGSRNAVIGKLARIRDEMTGRVVAPPKREKKPRQPRAPKAARPAPPRPHGGSRSPWHRAPRLVGAPLPPPLVVEAEPVVAGKPTILDIKPRQCRFPVGVNADNKAVFCADPVLDEKSSYCPACHARCYSAYAASMTNLKAFMRGAREREMGAFA